MKLLYAQFIESMSYQHNEKDGKFEVFRVGHENKARILEKNGNILECPCKVTFFSGIIFTSRVGFRRRSKKTFEK